MRNTCAVLAICMALLQNRGLAITVSIPFDTLSAGAGKGQIVLPVMVDSIRAVGGFQIAISVPRRISISSATGEGSLSAPFTVYQMADTADNIVFVHADGDGSTTISGSGQLVELICQVLDDTAGFAPLTIDTGAGYTEFYMFKGGTTVRAPYKTENGGITFVPSAQLIIESDTVSTTISADAGNEWDTIIYVPVALADVRGDRVQSFFLRLLSDNPHLSLAESDTAGTLAGILASNGGEYSSVANLDGSLNIAAAGDSATAGATDDDTTLVAIKALVHGDSSFTAAIFADSMTVDGMAEPFAVRQQEGHFEVTIVVKRTEVRERTMPIQAGIAVYPVPSAGIVRLQPAGFGGKMYRAALYDAAGTEAVDFGMGRGTRDFDLRRGLPDGAYVMRVSAGNSVFNKRILLLH